MTELTRNDIDSTIGLPGHLKLWHRPTSCRPD
jgi:hypothetical protein